MTQRSGSGWGNFFPGMQASERFFEVRGLRLHARVWGPTDGVPALLLHGWLDHAGSFEALAPLLAAEGPVAALDFRGHGDSAWAGAGGFYHFTDYLSDVDGALESLFGERPARLVGHSMGGALSLLYAAARPERVLHVSALDAIPLLIEPDEVPGRLRDHLADFRKQGWPRQRRLVPSAEEAAARLKRNNASLSETAARTLASGAVSADPAQGGAMAWKWDPLLRATSPLPLSEPVVQAVLAEVRAPVLVVRATDGYLADEEALRARLSRVARAEVAAVEGAPHHLHLERPHDVAALVLRAWRASIAHAKA